MNQLTTDPKTFPMVAMVISNTGEKLPSINKAARTSSDCAGKSVAATKAVRKSPVRASKRGSIGRAGVLAIHPPWWDVQVIMFWRIFAEPVTKQLAKPYPP